MHRMDNKLPFVTDIYNHFYTKPILRVMSLVFCDSRIVLIHIMILNYYNIIEVKDALSRRGLYRCHKN